MSSTTLLVLPPKPVKIKVKLLLQFNFEEKNRPRNCSGAAIRHQPILEITCN